MPEHAQLYTATNTLLLDDDSYKASKNPVFTHMSPPVRAAAAVLLRGRGGRVDFLPMQSCRVKRLACEMPSISSVTACGSRVAALRRGGGGGR